MSKRDEFITVIRTLRAASPTITDRQRIGLLQQAVQNYGLAAEDASEILKDMDLAVGEDINYFEVLGFSIDDIQSLNEDAIVNLVETAHKKCYSDSLRAGARVRPDGQTEEQWRHILNQARDTLKDVQKRREYIATRLPEENASEISDHTTSFPESEFQDRESMSTSAIETASVPIHQSTDAVSTLPNLNVPADMVLIPAGEFQMESKNIKVHSNEKRVYTVYVDAFYIDKYPVTNAQYKAFLTENPQWQKNNIHEDYHNGNYLRTWNRNNYPKGKTDHPVVNVSWYTAMAYAQWIGKRLPTEAEWEKAARGGLDEKTYPWGDQLNTIMANYGKHIGAPTPIGEYLPNDYGVYDMAGNVWEWCLDEYDRNLPKKLPSRNYDAEANSMSETINNFLSIKTSRVLRGGSWASSPKTLQVAYCGAAPPTLTYNSYGFRCVRAVTP